MKKQAKGRQIDGPLFDGHGQYAGFWQAWSNS
jgi:hypothetical protein